MSTNKVVTTLGVVFAAAAVGRFAVNFHTIYKREKMKRNDAILELIRNRPDRVPEVEQVEVEDELPPVVLKEVKLPESDDVIETIVTPTGDNVVSVSRMRVPEVEQVEVDLAIPDFWTSFKGRIKRPDVISVEVEDFTEGVVPPAKGFHHCSLGDQQGILHATKNHITVVIHVKGSEFIGLSTINGRFGSDTYGLALTLDQVKNFISGR